MELRLGFAAYDPRKKRWRARPGVQRGIATTPSRDGIFASLDEIPKPHRGLQLFQVVLKELPDEQ